MTNPPRRTLRDRVFFGALLAFMAAIAVAAVVAPELVVWIGGVLFVGVLVVSATNGWRAIRDLNGTVEGDC